MDAPQRVLADDAARRDALASHDRSLLVEAGAGSGKTAVMAGRIAMMLAEGGRTTVHRRGNVHRTGRQRTGYARTRVRGRTCGG